MPLAVSWTASSCTIVYNYKKVHTHTGRQIDQLEPPDSGTRANSLFLANDDRRSLSLMLAGTFAAQYRTC